MDRDTLLQLIRDKVEHPATPRELLQRLKIPRDQRPTLKRLLKDLAASGDLIETRGNRYGLPDRMNLIVGKITTHPRGFGFVVPDRPVDDVQGDIYIAGSNLNQAMHGDRVMARIERVTDRGAEGRIVRIIERGASTIVGRFEGDGVGPGFVVPFDRRLIMDVQIPHDEQGGAASGDMVSVEITRWPTSARGPLGRIVEVLGAIDEPGVDTEIIIRKYGIADAHSDDAITEAKRLGPRLGAAEEKRLDEELSLASAARLRGVYRGSEVELPPGAPAGGAACRSRRRAHDRRRDLRRLGGLHQRRPALRRGDGKSGPNTAVVSAAP